MNDFFAWCKVVFVFMLLILAFLISIPFAIWKAIIMRKFYKKIDKKFDNWGL